MQFYGIEKVLNYHKKNYIHSSDLHRIAVSRVTNIAESHLYDSHLCLLLQIYNKNT